MTSKIKVDNINKVSDDSNIIKKCGTTTTIGSGASNPIVVDGSAVTLGRCGGTVALASGATQTGFGRTGTVDWQTGSIKTATFTAANGEGYFANTSGGAFVMNLPAGTAGNIVSVVDYTNTFQTNNLTITPNGSQKIGGIASSFVASTEGQSLTLVYVDDIEGWKSVQDSTTAATGNPNLVATGGTITTSGDYKIHTFSGPGTFTVANASTTAANNIVSYLVLAGGGGSPGGGFGGGGAGGFREYKGPADSYTASPLNGNPCGTAVTLTAQAYPITVGGGGTAGIAPGSPTPNNGGVGNPSVFSTITSTGGGAGKNNSASIPISTGGSGGGGSRDSSAGGTGNTPPVTPPQGNNGGTGIFAAPQYGAGGGGGAGGTGSNGTSSAGGSGGNGVDSSINGSPGARAGGGGGGTYSGASGGAGGPGGGGDQQNNGQAETGGGAGGSVGAGGVGYAGGGGVVILRYKFQ
jgi:hypothetical protein